MEKKEIKPNYVIALLIVTLFIGLIFGYVIGKETISFYDDRFECDLILEQHVASMRGCNILYDIINNSDYSNERFECIEYLDNLYYLEFDENGDISYCEYNHW